MSAVLQMQRETRVCPAIFSKAKHCVLFVNLLLKLIVRL